MLHRIIEISVGEWRSLVARFVRDEEVPGSNPGSPTIACHFTKPASSVMRGFWSVKRSDHLPVGTSYRNVS